MPIQQQRSIVLVFVVGKITDLLSERTMNEHGPQVSIGVSVEVLSLHESQVSCLCPVCRVTTGVDIIALEFVAAMTIAQKFAPCN